jgi:hypothetical protein
MLALMAGPLDAAQGRGNGRGNQANAPSPVTSVRDSSPNSGFDRVQIQIIRDWFASPSNLKGLPPGLANREQLPPGLQKQLAKNGKLPPGLEKKIQPLPHDLEIRLPRLPDGRKRIFIAGNVIILDERTSLVIDILHDIFKR